MRPSGRANDQLRAIALEANANPYAEGSRSEEHTSELQSH